jgi:hypothetical protein
MADPRLRDYFINPFQTFGLEKPELFSLGSSKEEEKLRALRDRYDPKDPKQIGLWNTYNTELLGVQKDAQKAAFQGAQKGAPQSYTGKIGERFSPSKYQDTSMLPTRGSPKSDPARLQASPVGYDEKEWWRQDPYRSPVQENFSIFSMRPKSW